MTNTTTWAGTAGRTAGTAARGLLWAYRTIDWAEVAEIVLQGLQVAIVLTLLAGRATRRAWDALPGLSAKLGTTYARAIVPATKVTPMVHPLAKLGQQLEQLTQAAGCTGSAGWGRPTLVHLHHLSPKPVAPQLI